MTSGGPPKALERIIGLAAVLAPARAERLLSLVAGPAAGDAPALARELAARPRHERLAAFASACDAGVGGASMPGGSRAALLLDRLVRDASRAR